MQPNASESRLDELELHLVQTEQLALNNVFVS
jgi:hypothetical protein